MTEISLRARLETVKVINRTVEQESWGTAFKGGKHLFEKGEKIGRPLLTLTCFPIFPLQRTVDFSKNIHRGQSIPTFSSSWRSCLLLASREHRFCSGATTVQMHRPSGSCAELYTCQPSLGLIWVWGNQQQTYKTHRELKRARVCIILSKVSFYFYSFSLNSFLLKSFSLKLKMRLNNSSRQHIFIHLQLPFQWTEGDSTFFFLLFHIIHFDCILLILHYSLMLSVIFGHFNATLEVSAKYLVTYHQSFCIRSVSLFQHKW